MSDNPYLAHLNKKKGGSSTPAPELLAKEPLFGFLPRRVTSAQVQRALVRFGHMCRLVLVSNGSKESDVNPFTKAPHTAQYKKILAARKKLPVYAQMEEFYKMVSLFASFILGGVVRVSWGCRRS